MNNTTDNQMSEEEKNTSEIKAVHTDGSKLVKQANLSF